MIPLMNNETNNTIAALPESRFTRLRKSFWGEIIQIVIVSLLIVIPFRIYIAQPFIVSGTSMDDTFANGQYLIVDELTYRLSEPQRGDVLILRPPNNLSVYYIKRLIGLPGETVEIKNDVVTVTNKENPKGFILKEPYVKIDKTFPPRPAYTVTLKADEYLVFGDNRLVSQDSRIFGPIKREEIAGRPIFRLWPLSKINYLPGENRY